jgi:outer membrane immunogenic protein
MTLGKLIRIGAAALGALSVSMNADAADLNGYGGMKGGPMYGPAVWTGFYVGANGGYAWRDTSDQFAYPACITGCYPAYGGIGADGGFGGGQIGYNFQGIFGSPAFVAGIEADIQGADIKGSGATVPAVDEHYRTSLDWFGTVRGRLGYAASSTLIYFTGGFAFGGLRQHAEDNDSYTPNPIAYYESNGTVTGYVLGGGVEYKFNPSWSLKAEYQYLNFGKNDPALANSTSAPATAVADGYKLSEDAFHTVRVGVNYWVSPTYMPLK